MSFLGFEIGGLALIQLALTGLIFFAYALSVSARVALYDQSSERQMVLLVDFILRHHPTVDTISKLLKPRPGALEDASNDAHWLERRLTLFQSQGTLPTLDAYTKETIWDQLLLVGLAPVFAMATPVKLLLEGRQFVRHAVWHTDIRRNYASKSFVIGVGSLGWLALGLELPRLVPWGWLRILGLIVAITGVVGMFCAFLFLLLLVREQVQWKLFWQELLQDVMARAAKDGDHDLYNRALLTVGDVKREPDVPVPGALGTYVTVFAAVQAVLFWLATQLPWL